MSREANKALPRRITDNIFPIFIEDGGLDIGGGPDPVTHRCRVWELEPDGDAQYLHGVADESCTWVHSSHCLEHIADPSEALANWWRVLKVGGHLIVSVPDEDLYEQGVWPSTWNTDHKTSWSLYKKPASWSPVNRGLVEEIEALPGAKIIYAHTADSRYIYGFPRMDQSNAPWAAEVSCEVVAKKESTWTASSIS